MSPLMYQGEKVKDNYKVVTKAGGTVTEKLHFNFVDGMEQSHLELRGVAKYKGKSITLPTKKVADGVNTTYMLLDAAGLVPLKADGYEAILKQTAEGQILYKVNSADVRNSELKGRSIQNFQNALDEIKYAAEEEFSDETVTVSTYIDAKGKIRGVKVEGEDEYEEFMIILGKSDDKVRGEAYLLDGDKEPEFKAELVADGKNDVYTGNIDFTTDDETFTIEFDDYEVVDEEYGYFKANTRFIIPDVDDPIAIDFTSDGKSQSIAGDIKIEGTNYGRLTFTFGFQNGADPSVPSKKNAVMISDPDELEGELEEYVSEDDVKDFIEEILIKVGFDKDLAKEGAESAAKEIFNSYSNSGYDWDDDDYDYDYDWDDDDNYSSSAKTTTKAGSSSSSATTTTKAASTSSEYITPEYDEAYIVVADKNFDNYYWGYDKGELAKGSKFVKVKGNGTFTASIDAGTADPEGFTVLGVSLSDVTDNASIKINSLKIDGQEIKLSGDAFVENDFGLEAIIYADESYSSYLTEDSDEFKNAADLSSIGKWKHIDITFEVTDNEE